MSGKFEQISSTLASSSPFKSDTRRVKLSKKSSSWVTYSGLKSSPNHEIAKKYAEKGYGGIVSFGLKAGYDGALKFIENVELISFLANIGDAKSLVTHPASTTHSQLSEEQQLSTGVTPDLIRFSVGIEDIEDILADVDQALDKI